METKPRPATSSPALCTSLQLGNEWLTVRAGGLNRYAAGLAGGLEAIGAPQQWLVMGRGEELAGCPRYVRGAAAADAPLLARWRGMRRAFREALAAAPDVVASHFALYAYPVRRQLARRPHVVHFHGPWADESSVEGAGRLAAAAKHHLERRVYHTGDRFVTLSKAFARVLAERYGVDEGKIRVVPGGVALERFATPLARSEARERLGWPADRPTVLCVRRLARRMGLENLVEAVAELRARQPELLVMIGGSGPLREQLAARIAAWGLADHVRLLGFVAEDDLPLAYRAADLSIVPTQALEGFGLVVLESLASGTPVLVTPVGGLPEVVEGFAPQLILPAGTAGAIAAGIDAALGGDLAVPAAEACQQYVRDHFAWPTIARRVLDVYQETTH